MARIVTTITLVVLVLSGCGSSSIQMSRRLGSWDHSEVRAVAKGSEATITLVNLVRLTGEIIDLTPDSLTYRDAETEAVHVIPVSSIREVTATTTHLNHASGAVQGYVVGSIAGEVGATVTAATSKNLFHSSSSASAAGAGLVFGILGAMVGGAAGSPQDFEVTYLFTECPYKVGAGAVIEVDEILEETDYTVRVVYEGKVIKLRKWCIYIDRSHDPIRITMPRAWL